MTKVKMVFYLLTGLLLLTSIVFAQSIDKKGSKDHPLISRFNDSTIKHYEAKNFDMYILPLGTFVEKDGRKPWRMIKSQRKLSKTRQLEGKITRIQYMVTEEHSTTEIYRNYQLALKKAGFEILFTGKGEDLGRCNVWIEHLYSVLNPLSHNIMFKLRGEDSHQRYLSARLSHPKGDVYVSLNISCDRSKCPTIQLDVIEVKPMQTELVVINMDAMARELDRIGRVAIYGIYFDTNKADVKAESRPTLQEIVMLLQQNSELRLYVVGHTDNIGKLSHNMQLSQKRSNAVVEKLISDYAVDANRLKAYGVGPLAPVTSNKNEEGRAKNRRVELVEQ